MWNLASLILVFYIKILELNSIVNWNNYRWLYEYYSDGASLFLFLYIHTGLGI